jgi:hypothetical protein
VIVGLRGPLLLLAALLVPVLLAVLGLRLMGEDLGDLWRDVAIPAIVLASCVALFGLLLLTCVARRMRNRRGRRMARYQLVLSQADEATFEEVAASCEQLVQFLRKSLIERVAHGQPWLALESWFVPSEIEGETGTAALMLLCAVETQGAAVAALRRGYPDLTLRPDAAGEPLEFVESAFVPGHVARVRKARSWPLPIGGAAGRNDPSGVRSTMAGVIRQQQQARRLSCVRWCILPAADQLDSRAADRLARAAPSHHRDVAHDGDVRHALETAGGAMCFLELQAAIERREVQGRRGKARTESFGELQNACRRLLSPALSHRGPNHLSERLMVIRQGLYRRRWARGEPPWLPDPTGSTLMSPRELALLMGLPSLASEHALPLQRNTVPHLPIPTEVPRARIVGLPSHGA